MLTVWKEIFAIRAADGITFDGDGLRASPIRDMEYGTVHLRTTATIAREASHAEDCPPAIPAKKSKRLLRPERLVSHVRSLIDQQSDTDLTIGHRMVKAIGRLL